MIQANELRIGNLLNYDTAEGDVIIKATDFNVIHWASEDPKGFNLVHTPIPLTEEWLVKLGANNPNPFLIDKYWVLFLSNEEKPSLLLILNGISRICKNGICGYEVKCEYVHELQNLYFALTGKELEIKGGANG